MRHEDDPNTYSLYVWGYVMLMLQYYKIDDYYFKFETGSLNQYPGLVSYYGVEYDSGLPIIDETTYVDATSDYSHYEVATHHSNRKWPR